MGRGEGGGRRIGSVSERIELHVSLGVQNQIGWQARTNVHRDTGERKFRERRFSMVSSSNASLEHDDRCFDARCVAFRIVLRIILGRGREDRCQE